MADTILRGGRVIDPTQGLDRVLDVLIIGGRIAELGEGLSRDGATVIDADGLVVAPGFIDLHAHLCEPGGEHRETIATGSLAAAAGGFTGVCAMPDTDPVVDDPAAVGFVAAAGIRASGARIYPVASISKNRAGEHLTEIGEEVDAGAVAIADAGRPIVSSNLMRLALEYAQSFGIPVLAQPDDPELSRGGVMHEGVMSSRLGLRGKPTAAEAIMVARDLALAEMTGGRLHLQRITTAAAVGMIRRAKAAGVNVTAEVTPHHLTLTHEIVEGYGTQYKVDPPLRPREDVEAVRTGLVEGVIDCVVTDHQPQHYDEKEQAFADAPFGVVGLETAFAVLNTRLVEAGVLDLPRLIERLTSGPAKALGLQGGALRVGDYADVTLLDPTRKWTVDPSKFVSKSRNSPFAGWDVVGRVVATMVAGDVVFRLEG